VEVDERVKRKRVAHGGVVERQDGGKSALEFQGRTKCRASDSTMVITSIATAKATHADQ